MSGKRPLTDKALKQMVLALNIPVSDLVKFTMPKNIQYNFSGAYKWMNYSVNPLLNILVIGNFDVKEISAAPAFRGCTATTSPKPRSLLT